METSLTLLERLKDGNDQQAWQLLNDLYLPLLHRWIRRLPIPEEDHDDLAQEIFLQLSLKIKSFEHQKRTGCFRKWFKTMTLLCMKNFVRKKSNKKIAYGGSTVADLLKQYEDPQSDLSKQWNQQHEQTVMQYLLATVKERFSEKTWAAFQRTALDGCRATEVAEELSISQGAVHTAKSRVLAELRRLGTGLLEE